MAATSAQEESFTSSSSLPPQFYDVFLSFRGEDTRKNFTDHLYFALTRHGFSTFRDDNELPRGEEITLELLKSIERSRISVIVFSRNYADSRWCLDELAKIMECKSTLQQMVVPIFYDVDPSDVRRQRGIFAEAFSRHEDRYKGCAMEGKVKRWRDALTEVADLAGWPLQNVANGHESQCIGNIVKDIWKKLNRPYLNVANYPVGMHSRVEMVNILLCLGSDNVRMIGICGIGGLGKTTIAKAIYNLIYLKFDGSSFLANVKENSKQPNDLVGLQEQLLSDILKTGNQNITNVDHGTEIIKQRVWRRRVLVVLDDVDNFYQLNALAIRRNLFQSGSRIIVTTRDVSLLTILGVDAVYEPDVLTDYESLQLFHWYAFRNDHTREEYVGLSKEVVRYAGGLPLALEVLGSLLIKKSVPQWKSALESLKRIPPRDIQSKLRMSFDSLSEEQKDIFLDIACFFVGMDQNYVIKILEGCDFFSKDGLGVLFDRCLVRIELGFLTMHDLIRDMGREIVRIEHRKEPGERSRLWLNEDVLDVLTSQTGTKVVEGLVLNLPRSEGVQVNAEAFAQMNRLRLLVLNYVHVKGSYKYISKRLRWLCWFGFPLKSIPSNLFMEKLVAIDMRYSSLKQVWKGRKILSKLKILNLSHSYNLIETPDFSGVINLEMLFLNDCTRLEKVHQSIECLNNLCALDLENCKNLKELPQGIRKLTSLQNLSLSGCSKLEKLLGFKGSPSNSWFSLFSLWASPIRNPDSFSLPPAAIAGLSYIKILDLANFNRSRVPDELGSLISLKEFNHKTNNIYTLPASISISHLSQLQFSQLCTRDQSLPQCPVNLEAVNARHFTSSERMSIDTNFRKSPSLTLSGCHKLVENNIARDYRKKLLQNQDLSEIGGFRILFPGGEVPDLFNYRSSGSDLSFGVPLLPDRKIRGWILCVVLAGCIDELAAEEVESFYYPLLYHVKNKTKGLERRYQSAFDDIPGSLQDHTWLHYAPQHYLELQMEAGDEMEYSVIVTDHTEFQVKKCGVNLIYDEDEKDYLSNNQAMIQCASPSYRDAIFDKNLSADHVVADNKIVRHSYVNKCGVNLINEDDEKDYLSSGQEMIQCASPSYRDVNFHKDVSSNQAVAVANFVDLMEVLWAGFGYIDVNLVDSDGQTPLHVAVVQGHVEAL